MTPAHGEDVLAGQPLDVDDERALRLVRTHLDAIDPVPHDLGNRVKFAMTVASLEAEVAHLTHDSLELGAVRTTEYDRATTVTFESGSLSIMVTLDEGERSVTTLRGWVTVPGAEVELREHSRSSVTVADDEGRFVFEDVERGTVNLLIRLHDEPGSRPVLTPGIQI
jgi:hypothetical protein